MQTNNWIGLRRALSRGWVVCTLAFVALSFYFWSGTGAVLTLSASVYLALGFFLTENLIGIFTKVKQANVTGVMLVMVGKVLWLGCLFALSRLVPPGSELPLALGMGACLVALLVATLSHYGLPKVSDAPSSSGS